jgi:hypothetical protein
LLFPHQIYIQYNEQKRITDITRQFCKKVTSLEHYFEPTITLIQDSTFNANQATANTVLVLVFSKQLEELLSLGVHRLLFKD